MKHQLYLSTVLLFFIFISKISAQNPFDCIDAMEVCDNSTLNINFDNVEGKVDEQLDMFCDVITLPNDFLDEGTVWYKYNFKTNGNFLFTISSTLDEYDFDFFVFKSESNSCENLESIRCMLTGANYPGPSDSICAGPTGLSLLSTDIVEMPGCQIGDDNFLAPVEVVAGDVLYLAVLAFSGIVEYKIEHSGSAEISCLPLGLNELNNEEANIYPNPTNDALQIEILNDDGKDYKLELYNSTGRSVMSQNFTNKSDLDIKELPAGIYYAKIWSGDLGYYYKKIVKI